MPFPYVQVRNGIRRTHVLAVRTVDRRSIGWLSSYADGSRSSDFGPSSHHHAKTVRISVNILGGSGRLIWIFWPIHWNFVDCPWARVVLYENHISARKIGSLRVVLCENCIRNDSVKIFQKGNSCRALFGRTGPTARSTGFSG